MVNQPSLESASDEPLYNIGFVSRMTGTPVATLRVWERCYGFPKSVRTPGGHRLILEREVMRLRRLRWPVAYLGKACRCPTWGRWYVR